MFCLSSGTSPDGDLKMFLISHCFRIWEMRIAEALLQRCLYSVPPWILFWDEHCLCSPPEGHTLYSECGEIKLGTLEGEPCVWCFLWALGLLEGRQSLRIYLSCTIIRICQVLFLPLPCPAAVPHRYYLAPVVFLPNCVSGYFQSSLDKIWWWQMCSHLSVSLDWL